jgi:hypothetical protein
MGKIIDIAIARAKRAKKRRDEALAELLEEAEQIDKEDEKKLLDRVIDRSKHISRILDIQARILDKGDDDDETR